MKKILLFVIIFAIFLIAVPLMVQAEVISIPDPLKGKTIPDVLHAITGLLKVIVIPLGAIMIIIGGIQIMVGMSTGEKEKKVSQGKKTLKWAIVGIAIVLAVDFIVGLIKEILGAD